MNRRFGQASMIAYSSRSLPVSERKIFLNFFVKDVIYYFLFWIVPFMAGLAAAAPLISLGPAYFFLLFLSLSLSFLIGLSVMFLLSTIYVHSSRLLVAALVLFALAGILLAGNFTIGVLDYLPSLSFFASRSAEQLAISLLLIIVPSALSVIFMKVDYPEKKRRYRNSLEGLSRKLGFSRNSHFIAKDFLDLHRSEGGLGKTIFSLIFPIAFIWVMLFIFLKSIPIADFLLIFSILTGVIASSIYDWLTEYDAFTSYAFLPVKVSTLLKSKISGYAVFNVIPLVIIILAAAWTSNLSHLITAVILFLSVSSYALALKIYLTGLYPNVLLYNAKIFLAFLLLGIPILLALIFLSVLNPLYLLASPVLIIASFYLIKNSYRKWDSSENPTF